MTGAGECLYRSWLASSEFEELDRHFAKAAEQWNGSANLFLALGAALASRRTQEGHVCCDLRLESGRAVGIGEEEIILPDPRVWSKALAETRVVGRPGDFLPLILDEAGRLYLHRYWQYERKVADAIRARVSSGSPESERSNPVSLQRWFPPGNDGIDWQAVAALVAASERFCVISGGPGTGKTRTIVRLLAVLVDGAAVPPRVLLAAPTGKAAGRLQEAIRQVKQQSILDERIRGLIPDTASTLHRLLGVIPGTGRFRHNAEHRLMADCVVVDEASMVDLSLMAKLLEALPAHARLILVGDKDQLASVEAGAVFGDISSAAEVNRFTREQRAQFGTGAGGPLEIAKDSGCLTGRVVQLQRNYRFGDAHAISRVSRFIRAGEADELLRVFEAEKHDGDVVWRTIQNAEELHHALRAEVERGFGHCAEAPDAATALKEFERFRILAAVRHGAFGVGELNRTAAAILRERGVVRGGVEGVDAGYHGKPILVTRNDYHLRLFNGDLGVLWESGPKLRAYFAGPEEAVRSFSPVRLPEHEAVYAMTVHKSQGSEFEEVLLILPEADHPVLTRELLYTAVTRARGRVQIWGTMEVLRSAVLRRVTRSSGLCDRLKERG